MSVKFIFLNIIYFYFILTSNSYAYLDPGSGSIILQVLAFLGSFILVLWNKIKMILITVKLKFQKIFSKKKDKF